MTKVIVLLEYLPLYNKSKKKVYCSEVMNMFFFLLLIAHMDKDDSNTMWYVILQYPLMIQININI